MTFSLPSIVRRLLSLLVLKTITLPFGSNANASDDYMDYTCDIFGRWLGSE